VGSGEWGVGEEGRPEVGERRPERQETRGKKTEWARERRGEREIGGGRQEKRKETRDEKGRPETGMFFFCHAALDAASMP